MFGYARFADPISPIAVNSLVRVGTTLYSIAGSIVCFRFDGRLSYESIFYKIILANANFLPAFLDVLVVVYRLDLSSGPLIYLNL